MFRLSPFRQTARTSQYSPGRLEGLICAAFCYAGWFYFVDRAGDLLRSRDGLTHFEHGSSAIGDAIADPSTDATLRHTALRLHGDSLDIFYTRVGDAPGIHIHVHDEPKRGLGRVGNRGRPDSY